MTTTIPSAALVPTAPVFTNAERLALAGFLAAYPRRDRLRCRPHGHIPRQALQAHRQNAYSLLDRSAELLLACAGSTTWPGVPYFPLGSAFLGVAKVTEHPAVLAAATALDATPAQVGLA